MACLFNERDLDGDAALETEDLELIDLPIGQTFHGPEGLRESLRGFRTDGPDARAESTNTVAARNWVATEHTGRFTDTGTLTSPAGPIPPTGRRVTLPIAEIDRIRDGKIALLRAYDDLATLLRPRGLMPESRTNTQEQ